MIRLTQHLQIALSLFGILAISSGILAQEGCVDVAAINFDASAVVDDGSCLYCIDDIAGYDPIHFSSALNPNQETFVAQTFTAGGNYADIVVGVSVESCKENGPTDMILELSGYGTEPDWFNPIASVTVPEPEIPAMQGGCSIPSFEWVYVLFENVNLQAGQVYSIVMKGTSFSSIRWRRSSIPDDPADPYTGGTYWEYSSDFGEAFPGNSILDLAFSVCEYSAIPPATGCTEPTACNYDAMAITDDGTCVFPGCNDDQAVNYDASAGCDDGSCLYCIDDIAGYDPIHFSSALNPNQETFVAQTFTAGGNYADIVVGVSVESCKENGPTDMILELSGYGTEPDWFNPIASVTVPEPEIPAMQGGCSIPSFEWVYVLFENVNLQAGQVYSIVMKGTSFSSIRWRRSSIPDDPEDPYTGGTYWEYSSDFGEAFPGNSILDLAFSVCEYSANNPFMGCTEPTACNYDAMATTDDGSCVFPGCTIPFACNYDATAGCIDDSCEFDSCAGCTYSQASNFDPTATIDDGSCILPDESCVGDTNGDQVINTADLLALLANFGNTCP